MNLATRLSIASVQRTVRSIVSSPQLIRRLHTENDTIPPVFQIWGSNTDVGKTVFSAALLQTVDQPSLYLKPVQSGYPQDDDSAVVKTHAKQARPVTLFTYEPPISPDLAATRSDTVVSDDHIVSNTSQILNQFMKTSVSSATKGAIALIETVGGVLSPAPSGALQADVYRPLRLPAILIGDSRLGGISATLAAYESLRLRGYDVPAIVLFAHADGQLENEVSINNHIDETLTSVFLAPSLPPSHLPLTNYFQQNDTKQFFQNLRNHLQWAERYRLADLHSMSEEASKIFWYPFTQHTTLKDVTCFDSAHGDSFTAYDKRTGSQRVMTDALGSWWTNGVGHGNVDVTKAIAHASGRYGHVMFAEAVHKPALQVAKQLLKGAGAGWASRVFFSDDGSTAMEVALKMAFRKRAVDFPQRVHLPVKIVGLCNSYHGDTLGVMDCSKDSDFNELQTPWYEPRGLFFEAPTVSLRNGTWTVQLPDWIDDQSEVTMLSKEEVFSTERSTAWYGEEIAKRLDAALEMGEFELGALVMEPVLLGAGGMHMVDPVFQRALVEECRSRKIPIVFDEIFTGLWRLGTISGAHLLQCKPDIAAFGKLLTGGTVPIAVTLTKEDILRAFDGSSKREALLHGHSYTAHAIGCAAGVESLRQYEQVFGQGEGKEKMFWCENYAKEISSSKVVRRVSVIGTVLAVEVKSEQSGYAANESSQEIVRLLAEDGIFARPLGNCVYMMCTPVTEAHVCHEMTMKLMKILERIAERQTNEADGGR